MNRGDLLGGEPSALVVALLTLAAIHVVAGFMYGIGIPPAWPAQREEPRDTVEQQRELGPIHEHHATGAMTTAAANNVVGSGLSWDHLGAMLAWTLAGLVVVAWRFSWMSLEQSRRRRSAKPRR